MVGRIHLVLLGIGVLILCFLLAPKVAEPFQVAPTVVCFLCVCPTEPVLRAARMVSEQYKTYILCDNIECKTPDDPNLTFIKISDAESAAAGWTRSNITIAKPTTAWDKVLYYFCVKDTSPANLWIIEEDVFLPNAQLLADIDAKHPDADLIAKQNVREEDDPAFLWWFDADGYLEKPLYRSLVCATRLSRRMLDSVRDFVRQHKRLVFIEIIFNTLAVQQGMKMALPDELSTIIWRHQWTEDTIDDKHLFHPIKDVELHDSYRDRLSQIGGREN